MQSNNPLIEESFLSSSFFDPSAWFAVIAEVARHVFTVEVLRGLYFTMSVFAIFFIAVIIYTTIRIFEIRAKEHEYMHHQIHEYAHRHAGREDKTPDEMETPEVHTGEVFPDEG